MQPPRSRAEQAAAALYDEPRWYACYTRGRHEKRAAAQLAERGIESYLPLVTHVRRSKNRTSAVSLPAFPSYVFGRFALKELHRVLTTHGVATVVRINGYPTPIPEEEIEQVRLLIECANRSGATPELEEMLAGDRVRITEGAFRGVEGIIIHTRGRDRVLVSLSAIGYGLSVEVDRRNVERCDPGRPSRQ